MLQRTLRLLVIFFALVAAAWLAAGQPAPVAARSATDQDGTNRAALVVRFADGSVEQRCVAFSEPAISGAELLSRSGLQVIMDYNSGLGGAVCSIQGAGCAFPMQDCFCRCEGLACEYWAYYHWTNGGWEYSQLGASNCLVTDGALEGWSWGPGNWVSGTEPPVITFDQVCAPPATITPTPTATTMPTATATPTATSMPTAIPTATSIPVSVALPQVSMQVSETEVAPGACALLSWVAWDAEQVTLNGSPVNGQDQREVCPATTQRYLLVAVNAAGQVTREVTVQVAAATTATPASTATAPQTLQLTLMPPAALVPSATPSPTVQPTATPAAVQGLLPDLAPVVRAQEAPPTLLPQPTAISNPRPAPPITAFLARPATATPRPRRTLGADGRPTPTPVLVARADIAHSEAQLTAAADAQSGAPAFAAASRDFGPTLLVGYGSYLLLAAGLTGAGVWVVRRKSHGQQRALEGPHRAG